MSNVMLTPPWYTLVNEIKYTYGKSVYVNVGDLVESGEGVYSLPINVKRTFVAKALRQVIPVQFVFGNITVNTVVYDPRGGVVPVDNTVYTPETLAELFCTALTGNPLFYGTVLKPEGTPPTTAAVNIIIAKEIVQFYNDDISDLCGNYNEVAAKTFADVTNTMFPVELTVAFTTYDPDCMLQRKIYCPIWCYKNKKY